MSRNESRKVGLRCITLGMVVALERYELMSVNSSSQVLGGSCMSGRTGEAGRMDGGEITIVEDAGGVMGE